MTTFLLTAAFVLMLLLCHAVLPPSFRHPANPKNYPVRVRALAGWTPGSEALALLDDGVPLDAANFEAALDEFIDPSITHYGIRRRIATIDRIPRTALTPRDFNPGIGWTYWPHAQEWRRVRWKTKR